MDKSLLDNLFKSQKLFSAHYLAKCLGHGITCPTSQGLPDGIKQPIELNAKKAEALMGMTTAAWLAYSKDCSDLLAVCMYDNKPIHLFFYGVRVGQMGEKEEEGVSFLGDRRNEGDGLLASQCDR